MANKLTALYTGNDSTGRFTEVAISESGKAFFRVYEFNGYSVAPSPWTPMPRKVEFATHTTNVYTGERIELDEPLLEWGFKTLKKSAGKLPRYRLPAA